MSQFFFPDSEITYEFSFLFETVMNMQKNFTYFICYFNVLGFDFICFWCLYVYVCVHVFTLL